MAASNSIIKILDTLTANQISAGEVVERPCSVVKELVENAIDSGADKIDIKIKEGGIALISVSDNGCGMLPEDLTKCLMPHATSKLRSISDLDTLFTLGFRGEALAAIAAVSRLSIVSKPAEQDFAYEIVSIDGKQQLPTEAAGKNGTTVTVKDLFYNTPARRKFLKSQAAEVGYISDYLSHLSLSHPFISFSYHNEGKLIFKTAGKGNIEDTVAAIYGNNVLNELLRAELAQPILINGLVSVPNFTKPSRSHYNFFINGRWVQSAELVRCIDEAYHTLIPQGRYPFVILFLELSPAVIDVNVHPAKLEIKFRNFEPVGAAIKEAVNNALFGRKSKPITQKQELIAPVREIIQAAESAPLDSVDLNKALWDKAAPVQRTYTPPSTFSAPVAPIIKEKLFVPQEKPCGVRDFRYADLRILGQAAGTYIISTGEDALYITDQHAAHERLQYERFKLDAAKCNNGSAPLLIPIDIELSHQEAMLLIQNILKLTDMGFIIEHFGDNSFVLRAVPLWYEGAAADELIQSLLAEFAAGGKGEKENILEEKLFMAACKAAVKGNRYQSLEQLASLFEQLDANLKLLTCPHGRPITVKISYQELQKRFLRSLN